MRLDRLTLSRYGQFSDFTLDFGSPPDRHDFHVIYGDNEAGKSTSYNALLDLLFGITLKPDYSFRHGSKALRIDAVLSNAGKQLQLSRLKAGLYDHNDSPLNESVLAEFTRGLTRETYGTMFSMDEETLEQGGNDIVASKGDLATLLFSAAAGLGNINQRLDDIIDQARYYRPRARKNQLKEDLTKLREIDQQLKVLDTRASEFRALEAERIRLDTLLEADDNTINDLSAHIASLEKKKSAAGIVRRLTTCRTSIESFGQLPRVPAQWWQDLTEFVSSANNARSARSHFERELKKIAETLEALPEDDPVLNESEHIQHLFDTQVEINSLEKRVISNQAEFNRLKSEIEHLKQRLPSDQLQNITSPLFLNDELKHLQGELRKLDELKTLHSSAEKTHAEALARQTALYKKIGTEPASPDSLKRVLSVINSAEDSKLPVQLVDQAAELEALLRQQLLDLSPWHGDATALRQLSVPLASDVDSLDKALDKTRAHQQTCLDRCRHAEQLVQTCEVELGSTAQHNASISLEALNKIQDAVKSLWQEHRKGIVDEVDYQSLDRSADELEQLLDRQQQQWRERDANAEAASREQSAERALSDASKVLTEARKDLDAANAEIASLQTSLETLNESIGLSASTDIQALRTWLHRRETALGTDQALERVRALIVVREKKRSEYTQQLADSLKSLDATVNVELPSLEQLLHLVDTRLADLIQAATDYKLAKQQLDDQIDVVNTTAERLGELTRSMQSWEATWQSLTQGNCLQGIAIDDLHSHLAILSDLHAAQQSCKTFATDNDQLASLRELQRRRLAELSTRQDISNADSDEAAANCIDQLKERLDAARKLADRRDDLEQDRQLTETSLSALLRDSASLFEELDQRMQLLEVTSIEDLQRVLHDCQKRDELEDEVQNLTTDLQQLMGTTINDDDLAELVDLDMAITDVDLTSTRQSLEARITERDTHLTERQSVINQLDAIGSSNDVARLDEERSVQQLSMQEQVRETLKLRLGVAAAREGMRQYREAHQSSMLTQASAIFREITAGNFTGLSSQPDKKQRELLFAQTSDGTHLEAHKLSKGTRFQLFLALRLAAYKDYAATAVPLPFVADDILDASDNSRSARSLEQFQEISQGGQVIYLTHHRHIVDLAREVTSDKVQLHELPPRSQHTLGP